MGGVEAAFQTYTETLIARLSENWPNTPLFLKGRQGDFDEVFSHASFRRLMKEVGQDINCSYRDYGNTRALQTGRRLVMKTDAARAEVAYAAGATLTLANIQNYDDRIAAFATQLKGSLGYAGRMHCSAWLAPGGSGLPAHFDGEPALTLQISGRKKWSISKRPAVPWPRALGLRTGDGSPEYHYDPTKAVEVQEWQEECERFGPEDYEEHILEPGDTLYVPAGVWHSTEALDEDPTLSMNVHFSSVSILDVIAGEVRQTLESAPEWRNMPLRNAHGGRTEASTMDFMKSRLRELKEMISALEEDELRLECALSRVICNVEGRQASASPTAKLGPETRLEFPLHLPLSPVVGRSAEGSSCVIVFCGDSEVEFDDADTLVFARALAQTRSFTVQEAKGWDPTLDAAKLQEILEALLDAQVLVQSS